MCRAMARTLAWIHARDGRALAERVRDYFPDADQRVLAGAFDAYLKLGLWNATPIMSQQGLEWLRDAGLQTGFLKRKVAFEEVADMRFAKQALG
jgi:NitT/TauT family transport system substrate-binding protein